MSGQENLLAGVSGFASGIKDVMGLIIQDRLARRAKEQDLMAQEESTKRLIPYQQQMERFKTDEAIRAEQAKPAKLYQPFDQDTKQPIGEPMSAQPVPFSRTPVLKEKDDIGQTVLIKKFAQDLPKMKDVASSQKINIESIRKAKSLLNRGVSGKGGEAKAFLAPYAEMLGVDSQNLSDAQAYQLLTRAIVGPMRLDIVGPGPVSEWEQKLMQQISGGGGTSKQAASELLDRYEKLAQEKINNYNSSISNASELSPSFSIAYQPIDFPEEVNPPVLNPEKKTSGRKPLSSFYR